MTLSAYVALCTAFEALVLAFDVDGLASAAAAAFLTCVACLHAFPAAYVLRVAWLRAFGPCVPKVVRGPALGMATSATVALLLALLVLGGTAPRAKAVLLSMVSEVAAAASVLAFARRRPVRARRQGDRTANGWRA